MLYDEMKQVAKQPSILASLAPFINPATLLPIVAIGALVLVTVKKTDKLKQENKKLAENKRILEEELETLEYYEEEEEADLAVEEPLDSTVANGQVNGSPTVENISDEELKKEMIRQTMSELGKRSAAARAKRNTKEN